MKNDFECFLPEVASLIRRPADVSDWKVLFPFCSWLGLVPQFSCCAAFLLRLNQGHSPFLLLLLRSCVLFLLLTEKLWLREAFIQTSFTRSICLHTANLIHQSLSLDIEAFTRSKPFFQSLSRRSRCYALTTTKP